MGIEIEYPLGYARSGDSLFRDTGPGHLSNPLLLPLLVIQVTFTIICIIFLSSTALAFVSGLIEFYVWRIGLHSVNGHSLVKRSPRKSVNPIYFKHV